MKINLGILGIAAAIVYSCQSRDSADSSEDVDSITFEMTGIDRGMLKKWNSFSRESDSIISGAQLTIAKEREKAEFHPPDERQYMITCSMEAQEHLDEFKSKVKYIREFATHIGNLDPALQQTRDSLKLDYIQEKLKLEEVLSQFK